MGSLIGLPLSVTIFKFARMLQYGLSSPALEASALQLHDASTTLHPLCCPNTPDIDPHLQDRIHPQTNSKCDVSCGKSEMFGEVETLEMAPGLTHSGGPPSASVKGGNSWRTVAQSGHAKSTHRNQEKPLALARAEFSTRRASRFPLFVNKDRIFRLSFNIWIKCSIDVDKKTIDQTPEAQ